MCILHHCPACVLTLHGFVLERRNVLKPSGGHVPPYGGPAKHKRNISTMKQTDTNMVHSSYFLLRFFGGFLSSLSLSLLSLSRE